MKEVLQKKTLFVVIPLLIALLSVFVLSGPASSPDLHGSTLAALEEKQTTVLELSAASAAASAAITLIPGDVATPIADKLADLSSHFLLVLCAVFLEKYLLTITGTVTFSFLIPVSCLLYVLYVLFDWKSLRLLAARLTAFGLLIFLVIPASVYVSDLIEDSYQASIEATIETARDAAAELESESETAGEGEKGFFSGLISTVTDGVSGITDKVGEMVNRFMEALAVMLVTCCAIPVLGPAVLPLVCQDPAVRGAAGQLQRHPPRAEGSAFPKKTGRAPVKASRRSGVRRYFARAPASKETDPIITDGKWLSYADHSCFSPEGAAAGHGCPAGDASSGGRIFLVCIRLLPGRGCGPGCIGQRREH